MVSWYWWVRSWADAFKMMSFGDWWWVMTAAFETANVFLICKKSKLIDRCFVSEVTPSKHLHENHHDMLLRWHCCRPVGSVPTGWFTMAEKTFVRTKHPAACSVISVVQTHVAFLFWENWENKPGKLQPPGWRNWQSIPSIVLLYIYICIFFFWVHIKAWSQFSSLFIGSW